MVSREFSKVWCSIAALVTLIEAVVWGGAAIYSIGVYKCVWGFLGAEKSVSSWSMLHITYFMGDCTGKAGALPYDFTPPSLVASNLQIWMWIYAIASAAWIPGCILLFVAGLKESCGAMLYYPWIGLTASFIVLDLVGAVYHLVGLFSTTTADDYAKFTADTTWANLTQSQSSAGITTWLPSLYVTLFFCRLLLIWIINIASVYTVYKASSAGALHETEYTENNQSSKNSNESRLNEAVEPPPRSPTSDSTRYRVDEFGIPVEEINNSGNKEANYYQREDRTLAFEINPGRSGSSSERWQDRAPPIASGVKVPPELNKFEPFSYIAGDQPQRRRNLSRSNSTRTEYPSIPRPDYTVADRRSAPALELVPNRFRVPSPKRPAPQSLTHYDPIDHSPLSNRPKKIPPAVPLKKPHLHLKTYTVPEGLELVPDIRYITPKPVSPKKQKQLYNSQATLDSNYNIRKLY